MQLQPQCVTVIHHKLRQRAAAIDMEPQIQEKCMTDLSAHCTNRHGKGDVRYPVIIVAWQSLWVQLFWPSCLSRW